MEANMARVEHGTLEQCELAAQAGQSDALYNLGLIYSTGSGVDVDFVVAHKWFNLAALRGSSEAQDRRSDMAREMEPSQIAEAQRQAREWLQQH
tara:strand:- start:791 stop:1072 length:282 start_codon:yes stop_codon:yes gene_type:complete